MEFERCHRLGSRDTRRNRDCHKRPITERKILRKIFKATCLSGTNDDKRKAKEAYLTCQTKLRDEIEREDKNKN